jgi:hypothetical protein
MSSSCVVPIYLLILSIGTAPMFLWTRPSDLPRALQFVIFKGFAQASLTAAD